MEYTGPSAFMVPHLSLGGTNAFIERGKGESALCMPLDNKEEWYEEEFGESRSQFSRSFRRSFSFLKTIEELEERKEQFEEEEEEDEGEKKEAEDEVLSSTEKTKVCHDWSDHVLMSVSSSESCFPFPRAIRNTNDLFNYKLSLLDSAACSAKVELNTSLNESLALLTIQQKAQFSAGPSQPAPPSAPTFANAPKMEHAKHNESLDIALQYPLNHISAATDSLNKCKMLSTEECELDASLRSLLNFRLLGHGVVASLTTNQSCIASAQTALTAWGLNEFIISFEALLRAILTYQAVFAKRILALGPGVAKLNEIYAGTCGHKVPTVRAVLEESKLRWINLRLELKRKFFLTLLTGQPNWVSWEALSVKNIGCNIQHRDALSTKTKTKPASPRFRRGAARSRYKEEVLTVLLAWWDAHQTHPFPSPIEKRELAQKTSLDITKVGVWFTNMRTRKWKANNKAEICVQN